MVIELKGEILVELDSETSVDQVRVLEEFEPKKSKLG